MIARGKAEKPEGLIQGGQICACLPGALSLVPLPWFLEIALSFLFYYLGLCRLTEFLAVRGTFRGL